jgi:gas vesicle protein
MEIDFLEVGIMRVINFSLGFLIGTVVGATIVLLTTPQSGSDLQSGMRNWYEGIVAEGRRAADARRAELEARLATLKGV